MMKAILGVYFNSKKRPTCKSILPLLCFAGTVLLQLEVSAQSTFRYFTYYDNDSTQLKESAEIRSSDKALHGFYKSFFQNGVTRAEGYYKNNVPDSLWTYYYQNGNRKASGLLVEGKQNGLWKYFYEYGGLKAEGNLTDGVKNGEWVNFFENEDEVVKNAGDYENGLKDGIWSYYYEDGNLKAQVYYHDGNGTYTEFYPTGETKIEGQNENEISTGLWTYYFKNGEIQAQGAYQNGLREGMWLFKHENGEKSAEGAYVNGKKQGSWKYWHKNGVLSSEGTLEEGVQQGVWKLYYNDGALKSNTAYQNGDGEAIEYYPGGQIMSKGMMKAGNKDGKWEFFDEEGNLEGTANFDHGYGDFKSYHSNDSLKISGQLHNNRRVGLWTMYDENGEIEGTYRPIYEEDNPTTYRVTNIDEESIERVNSDKPDYIYEAKSNRFYDEQINEYKGLIFTSNPLFSAIGFWPIAAEYYFQDRLGYELYYAFLKDPFYQSYEQIDYESMYEIGHQLKVRQKYYLGDIVPGLLYFGHELNFLWKNYNIKEIDDSVIGFPDLVITANETAAAYGLFLGYKWMYNTGESGLVIDAFIGVDIGYRSWSKKYEPNPEYDSYFIDVNQKSLYLPFEFGLMFGFSSSNIQKSSPR